MMPDYAGPVEGDVVLDDLVNRHPRFPNGEPHKALLMRVEEKYWNDVSARKQILAELGLTHGLGDEWYADKCTYEEEALRCFNNHSRPKQGCIDWQDDNKRIGNPTKIGWKAGPKVYLCNFCPVRSWVDTQKRHAKGLYKEH